MISLLKFFYISFPVAVKLPVRGKAAARVRERRQVAQLTRTVEKQAKQLRAARSTTRRHQSKVTSLTKICSQLQAG